VCSAQYVYFMSFLYFVFRHFLSDSDNTLLVPVIIVIAFFYIPHSLYFYCKVSYFIISSAADLTIFLTAEIQHVSTYMFLFNYHGCPVYWLGSFYLSELIDYIR
jgi:hypothetical protein